MQHKENKELIDSLKTMRKALANQYSVKVGLLAEQGGSEPISDNLDLAGLGAVQEYGAKIKVTDKMRGYFRHEFGVNLKKSTQEIEIPARSWLYAPIKDKGFRKLIDNYIGDADLFKETADKESIKKLANLIGEAALLQIQKAFENGGINGEWSPNSPLTIARKGSSKPLIDTQEFRRHITFEVEGS